MLDPGCGRITIHLPHTALQGFRSFENCLAPVTRPVAKLSDAGVFFVVNLAVPAPNIAAVPVSVVLP